MKKLSFIFGIAVLSLLVTGCNKPPVEEMETAPTPPVMETETGMVMEEELPPVEEVLPPLEEGMMEEEVMTEEAVEEPIEEGETMEMEEEGGSLLDSLKDMIKPDEEVVAPEEVEVSEPEPVEIPTEEEATEYEDAETCRDEGGSWIRGQDAARTQLCLKPYPDAGSPCEDEEDCNGKCLARLNSETDEYEGYCQKNNNPYGCFVEMKDGKVQKEICIN